MAKWWKSCLKPHEKPFSGERDRLYTPGEVADALHISMTTVYRLMEQHRIPFLKFGGSYRISGDTLTRWTRGEFNDLINPPK